MIKQLLIMVYHNKINIFLLKYNGSNEITILAGIQKNKIN